MSQPLASLTFATTQREVLQFTGQRSQGRFRNLWRGERADVLDLNIFPGDHESKLLCAYENPQKGKGCI